MIRNKFICETIDDAALLVKVMNDVVNEQIAIRKDYGINDDFICADQLYELTELKFGMHIFERNDESMYTGWALDDIRFSIEEIRGIIVTNYVVFINGKLVESSEIKAQYEKEKAWLTPERIKRILEQQLGS